MPRSGAALIYYEAQFGSGRPRKARRVCDRHPNAAPAAITRGRSPATANRRPQPIQRISKMWITSATSSTRNDSRP